MEPSEREGFGRFLVIGQRMIPNMVVPSPCFLGVSRKDCVLLGGGCGFGTGAGFGDLGDGTCTTRATKKSLLVSRQNSVFSEKSFL